MTRTAADTETVPVAVADDVRTVIARVRCPEHGTACGGISCCCFDKHAELGLDLAAVERLEAALPEPEDPDAELVEAMADEVARRYVSNRGGQRQTARAMLNLLRDHQKCFHPDHQGDDWEPSVQDVAEALVTFAESDVRIVLGIREKLIAQHRETEQP